MAIRGDSGTTVDVTYVRDGKENTITLKRTKITTVSVESEILKENIGLIEVMGLAVLPSRLKDELNLLAGAILEGKDFSSDPKIGKHYEWVQEFLPKYASVDTENIRQILKEETGHVFARVLEDAGVYKRTPEGKASFLKFINTFA